MSWVRNGGLSRLLFLLPLLLIFGAFSWYPIVRLVLMSFQHTNEVTDDVGRAPELQRGAERPALPDRRKEHRRVRRSGAALRLPDPADRGGADERGQEAAWAVRRARLPARCDSAGRGRAALEDLLRRWTERCLQHDPRLVRHRSAAVDPVHRPRRCRRSCSSPPGRTPAAP